MDYFCTHTQEKQILTQLALQFKLGPVEGDEIYIYIDTSHIALFVWFLSYGKYNKSCYHINIIEHHLAVCVTENQTKDQCVVCSVKSYLVKVLE